MKKIHIANYSIYSDGVYTSKELNFRKLYRGVRVNVDVDGGAGDSCFIHFSIRTAQARPCIWKRASEEMRALVFEDESSTVTCDFDNDPKNVSPHTLTFNEEVYEELKHNIPVYREHCGVKFKKVTEGNTLTLLFGE